MHESQLFEHYPVTSGAIKQAAEDTRTRVSAVHGLISDVETAHREAVSAVEGILTDTVANAPADATAIGSTVRGQAEFAAGCLELFGLAVYAFDYGSATPRSVSKLNSAYTTALGSDFGVTLGPVPADATPAEKKAIHDTYSTDYGSARTAVINNLTAEYTRLDDNLDTDADEVSAMLARGPNQKDLLALWTAGALSPYAPLIYSQVDFTLTALPPDWFQQEIYNYLMDNPDVLVDPPPALLALLGLLPTAMKDEIVYQQSIQLLKNGGYLEGNPSALYEEWVRTTLATGMNPADLVVRAEQEGVDSDIFAPLEGLQIIRGPDGRPFVLLEGDEGARKLTRLTELLNGGAPSENDWRRDGNSWTYDGPLFSPSDVEFVLDSGGALITTPNGTLMGMGGNQLVELYSQKGGTTWMDIFMVNGHPDDPEQALIDIVETGMAPGSDTHTLESLLRHESIHSEQWAEQGYFHFIYNYLRQGSNGCENSFEEEAGWEDGGYSCG